MYSQVPADVWAIILCRVDLDDFQKLLSVSPFFRRLLARDGSFWSVLLQHRIRYTQNKEFLFDQPILDSYAAFCDYCSLEPRIKWDPWFDEGTVNFNSISPGLYCMQFQLSLKHGHVLTIHIIYDSNKIVFVNTQPAFETAHLFVGSTSSTQKTTEILRYYRLWHCSIDSNSSIQLFNIPDLVLVQKFGPLMVQIERSGLVSLDPCSVQQVKLTRRDGVLGVSSIVYMAKLSSTAYEPPPIIEGLDGSRLVAAASALTKPSGSICVTLYSSPFGRAVWIAAAATLDLCVLIVGVSPGAYRLIWRMRCDVAPNLCHCEVEFYGHSEKIKKVGLLSLEYHGWWHQRYPRRILCHEETPRSIEVLKFKSSPTIGTWEEVEIQDTVKIPSVQGLTDLKIRIRLKPA
eukprot:Gregarina_sp_Poly_1__9562@NODE_602_length_7224_cov_31_944949_g460_i1_p2_GENE_NODE_602_length_7224_cov_31_944949_g460_i1NODE_602_length_7224_cov_31_944949_g460_i1_p2_ORF_typecomplete_len402_score32_82Fbox/PF00646_33/0_014_NODE_602_length_7224_cov_31_944949_g460_i12021407